MIKYTYSISADTANGKLDSDKLHLEISTSDIIIAIDRIGVSGDSANIWMKASLSETDENILTVVISEHDGESLLELPTEVNLSNVAETTDHFLRVTVEPREGDAKNFYTPNFCDQTTWYENSTRETGVRLKKTDNVTFIFDDPNNLNQEKSPPWIDLYHGNMFQEDLILQDHPEYNFELDISNDGGHVWERMSMNSLSEIDQDYSVDFKNGIITFNEPVVNHAQVRVNCAKASDSLLWTLAPDPGKRLKLIHSELQFSKDVELCADIVYEVWAYNPYWLPTNGQPLKVPVPKGRSTYKSVSDMLYESSGVYPVVPPFGGSGPRGINNQETIIFPFSYNTARDLSSAFGVEIRFTTKKAHVGTFATTTFYCLQEDE